MPTPFGTWLKQKRKERNLTAAELARMTDGGFFDQSRISALEVGRRSMKPTRSTVIALCLALGVSGPEVDEALALAGHSNVDESDPDTAIRQNVANKISYYRTMAGYTQEQLADILGTSRQTYKNYEQGEAGLNVVLLQKIANAVKVPIAYFFDSGVMLTSRPITTSKEDLDKTIKLLQSLANA